MSQDNDDRVVFFREVTVNECDRETIPSCGIPFTEVGIHNALTQDKVIDQICTAIENRHTFRIKVASDVDFEHSLTQNIESVGFSLHAFRMIASFDQILHESTGPDDEIRSGAALSTSACTNMAASLVARIWHLLTQRIARYQELPSGYSLVPLQLRNLRIYVAPDSIQRFLRSEKLRLQRELGRAERAGSWIPVPPTLARKRCIISVQNKDPRDRRCAAYAVMAYFLRNHPNPGERPPRSLERLHHYVEQRRRRSQTPSQTPSLKGQEDDPLPPLRALALPTSPQPLDFTMFDGHALASSQALSTFEQRHGVALYLYLWLEDRDTAILIRPTRLHPEHIKHEIVLVAYSNAATLPTGNSTDVTSAAPWGPSHWAWCSSFGRLMASGGLHYKHRQFWCHRCARAFWTAERLQMHLAKEWCVERDDGSVAPRREVLADRADGKPTHVCFDRYEHLHLHPAVLYYDFETRQRQPQPTTQDAPTRETRTSKTHEAISFAWALSAQNWTPRCVHHLYVGSDASLQFVRSIAQVFEEYQAQPQYPLTMSPEEEAVHRRQTTCYACGVALPWSRLCRDHNHLLPRHHYRGGCCRACNSRMKQPRTLLCVAHNAGRFDMNFVIQGLQAWKACSDCPPWVQRADIQPLQRSENQFISLRFGGLLFIDSFRFLSSSLAKLIDMQRCLHIPLDERAVGPAMTAPEEATKTRTSTTEPSSLPTLVQAFPFTATHHPWRAHLDIILQKLRFPYAALELPEETWAQCPAVPARDFFKDTLGGGADDTCNSKEYACVCEVAQRLAFRSFLDFHNCYLATDCMALLDIVEHFRHTWHRLHGLDPLQALTGPSASWAACLRHVGAVFELPTTSNGGLPFVDAVNRGIMGGLCWAATPYVARKPDGETLALFDFCSLYPSVMTQPLPIGKYQRCPELVGNMPAVLALLREYRHESAVTGYLLDVTFEVPVDLHDEVDLPPLARVTVPWKALSHHQQEARRQCGLTESHHHLTTNRETKLVPFLGRHRHSVRHVALLQFYIIELGCRLLAVHDVWSFAQAPVLRTYITDAFERRRQAQTRCESEVLKLQLNSIYGMTLQSAERRCKSTLSCDEATFWTKATRNGYDWNILQREPFLGMLHAPRHRIVYDTPRVVGWAILDLSKVRYYTFWYRLKAFYRRRGASSPCRFIYGDTDSVLAALPTTSLAADMSTWNHELQTKMSSSTVPLQEAAYYAAPNATTFPPPPLAFDCSTVGITSCPFAGALGAIKFELPRNCRLEEIVCLASKLYALRLISENMEENKTTDHREEEVCRGKGLPRALVQGYGFERYKQMLFNPTPHMETYTTLRPSHGQVLTKVVEKRALSWTDDKSFVVTLRALTDEPHLPIVTRPHGHVRNGVPDHVWDPDDKDA